VLQYLPPVTPSELQLRVQDGVVHVYFGVWPLWLYLLEITATAIGAAATVLATSILLINIARGYFGMLPPETLRLLAAPAIFWLGIAMVTLALTGARVYRLRHWGRLQRILAATSSGMTFTFSWLGRARHRFWSADQFTSLELREVHSIISSSRTITELRIRRKGKWPRTFRLASTDSQLPKHIAEQLAATLGCPVRIR